MLVDLTWRKNLLINLPFIRELINITYINVTQARILLPSNAISEIYGWKHLVNWGIRMVLKLNMRDEIGWKFTTFQMKWKISMNRNLKSKSNAALHCTLTLGSIWFFCNFHYITSGFYILHLAGSKELGDLIKTCLVRSGVPLSLWAAHH